MAIVDEAFLAAQLLTPADKLELISRLWDTIPPAGWRPSDGDLAEVKRRWEEYESGREKAIPWGHVCDSVHRRLESHD